MKASAAPRSGPSCFLGSYIRPAADLSRRVQFNRKGRKGTARIHSADLEKLGTRPGRFRSGGSSEL